MNKQSALAAGELITAATLWGFGFIASVWALKAVDAFELTFVRFALGVALSFALLARSIERETFRHYLWLGFWPALFLFGTLVFQTWGLHYTTATKSGFITTLYVVFVPVLEAFHSQKKIPAALWVCVAGALLGTLLIVNVGLDAVNFGDILTFVCALFATMQIYYMGLISPKIARPFTFNAVQALWCLAFSVPFLFHDGLPRKLAAIASWPPEAVFGVCALAFGSTVLAFFLQVKAQSRLSPTVASLLCLLESPFAMGFAMVLLGERLGTLESAGAALIFVSAAAASYIESVARSKT